MRAARPYMLVVNPRDRVLTKHFESFQETLEFFMALPSDQQTATWIYDHDSWPDETIMRNGELIVLVDRWSAEAAQLPDGIFHVEIVDRGTALVTAPTERKNHAELERNLREALGSMEASL